jgi:hypothetical protein
MTKQKKNISKKSTIKSTLDQKHMEKISEIDKNLSSLPEKKRSLENYKKNLEILLKKKTYELSIDDMRNKTLLNEKIRTLEYEIKKIQDGSDQLNYLSKCVDILTAYYDGSEADDGDNDDTEDVEKLCNNYGKKSVFFYFNKENEKNKKPLVENSMKNNTSSADSTKKKSTRMNKAKLFDCYMSATSNQYTQQIKKNENKCSDPECDGTTIIGYNESFVVCKKCGLSESVLLFTDKPKHNETVQDSGAYKRMNHLTEILSQLQAKESTDIPPEVFESIYAELKKRKKDKNDLDMFGLRQILKKINSRKHYEHVPHILQIINGKVPPNFNRNDELKIKKMFKEIQEPFAIYCPKDRKNFLNYSYVLHKFCELLDLDEYVGYFPLLKNIAKLRQHDNIWKLICHYNRWEYHKSI